MEISSKTWTDEGRRGITVTIDSASVDDVIIELPGTWSVWSLNPRGDHTYISTRREPPEEIIELPPGAATAEEPELVEATP